MTGNSYELSYGSLQFGHDTCNDSPERIVQRRYTLSPMTKFRQISTNTKNIFLIFDIKSLSGLQANFLISSRLLSPTVYILKDIE